MCGQYQHFCNLYMSRSIGRINSNVGNIVARKRRDALVNIRCAIGVTAKTNVTEISLNKTRLQVRNTDGCISNINTQSVRKSLHSSLCGTIYIASSIGSIAGNRPDIDNVTTVTCNHTWHDKTRHRQ